jgi:hypothetical protein
MLSRNAVQLTSVPGVLQVTREGEQVIGLQDELNTTEVLDALKYLFSDSAPVFTFFLADLVLLAETSLGAQKTADVVLLTLESASDSALTRNDPERAALVQRLGFVLLRCPKAAADGYRDRLRVWLDERARVLPGGAVKKRAKTEGVGSVWRSVDLVANGNAAIERSAFRVGAAPDVGSVLFASSAKVVSQAVGARAKGLVAPHDARLAFLGGEEVLAALVKQLSGLPPERLCRFVETFGLIRSPLISKWLKTIARKEPTAELTLQLHG